MGPRKAPADSAKQIAPIRPPTDPSDKGYLKQCRAYCEGSHVVSVDFDMPVEISYIQLALRLVVGGGFEPPKASPTDLQSVPFDHSGTPPELLNIRSTKTSHLPASTMR